MAEQLDEEWVDKTLPSLTKGLNRNSRPELLDDEESPNLLNVFPYKQEIRIDTGYKLFAGVIRGRPRVCTQFFQTGGSGILLLITDATMYSLINDQWQYTSDGVDNNTTAIVAAGATTVPVADRTGFAADQYIGITLDDGSQHQTTIDSAYVTATGAGNLTIDDAIPVGRQANNGASVVKAKDLSGSADIPISFVTVTWEDKFVFTNGIDAVQVFDGSTVEDLVTGLGFTLVARVVTIFKSQLFAMFTLEGGTSYPFRMRRSNGTTITDWTGGTAGFSDLLDDESFIVGSANLGPYMIVYKERSIVRVTYIGSADTLLKIETMIFGEGALSIDSIVDFGEFHFFAGNSNFYEYRGGRSLDPVGDQIRDEIFGQQGSMNNTYQGRSFVIYVEELDEAWFFFPNGDDEWPSKMARYNIAEQAWFERVHNNKFSGFGFYQSDSTVTWQNIVGIWQDALFPWNSQVISSDNPTTLLCDAENNQVYEFDYIVGQDNGVDIPYYIETPDFIEPGHELRLDQMWAQLAGTNITVEVSTDQGENWQSMGSYNTTEYKHTTFFKQVEGDYLRFKFSGSGGGFRLGLIGFMYKIENMNR